MREVFSNCSRDIMSRAKKAAAWLVPSALTCLLVSGCAWDNDYNTPRVYMIQKQVPQDPPPQTRVKGTIKKLPPMNKKTHVAPASQKGKPVTQPATQKKLPPAQAPTTKMYQPAPPAASTTEEKMGPNDYRCMSPSTSRVEVCGPDGRIKRTGELGITP